MTSPDLRLDTERTLRIGMPEAVLCQFKSVEQCLAAIEGLLAGSDDVVIATRIRPDQRSKLLDLRPDNHDDSTMVWRPRAPSGRLAAVVSAGTSDAVVADEAALTLTALGHGVIRTSDVGVAGVHRLTAALPEFETANAIIAVAGMEGALPTVLAGLVGQPIIAVPTSVGYGSAFEGVTPLLTMMASCAPGIAVVGIDNGYGAACAVHRIFQSRS